METRAQNIRFCADLLRKREPDWYFGALFLPENIRELAFVLHAFDQEIRRVPDLVSEPMPGEIRIQWWRDVIAGRTSGDAAANPLSAALVDMIAQHDLPQLPFQNYLDARVFDLYHDPMPDMATLEGYCGETASVWFLMLLQALDRDLAAQSAEFCGHAGMVAGLARVFSRLERDRQRQRCYVPAEVMDEHDLTVEGFFAADWKSAPLNKVFSAMKVRLQHHYESMLKAANRETRAVALPVLPLANAVSRAQDATHIAMPGPLSRRWTITKAALLGFPARL